MTILGEWDILLGDLTRKGPLCFCHSYRRYRQFTRPLAVGERIDAIVRTEDGSEGLREVFGRRYSKKEQWP
jgi:hypothetical protein